MARGLDPRDKPEDDARIKGRLVDGLDPAIMAESIVSQDYANTASSSSAMMLVILIAGLTAGPAVSL